MYADVTVNGGTAGRRADRSHRASSAARTRSTVLVVDAQNRVQKREVHTGIEDSNNVEILSGLSEGDRVIIGNLASYRDGQLVRPKESAPLPCGREYGVSSCQRFPFAIRSSFSCCA